MSGPTGDRMIRVDMTKQTAEVAGQNSLSMGMKIVLICS